MRHSKDQHSAELAWFLDLVRGHGVKRYLEIGARHGHTFRAVMQAIGGGHGAVVDNDVTSPLVIAVQACGGTVIAGDSRDRGTVRAVRELGPYDLILIDADHRYEFVKADWENYGPMAPIIAFHDTHAPEGHMSHGNLVGVPKLWAEIKAGHRVEEFHAPGSEMGFGVVFR